MAASAEATFAVMERPQDPRRVYRERFQMARRLVLMLRIVDLAFKWPVQSISSIVAVQG